MLRMTSEQSKDAGTVLADIESSLRRFLKHAPKLKLDGCQFGLTLATRQANDCLDAMRELRKTIFGEGV